MRWAGRENVLGWYAPKSSRIDQVLGIRSSLEVGLESLLALRRQVAFDIRALFVRPNGVEGSR